MSRLFSSLLCLFVASAAHATTTLTLSTHGNGIGSGFNSQGWWADEFFAEGATNDNYLTGHFHSSQGPANYRGFFTFYVPTFDGTLASAVLRINAGVMVSDDPQETVGFFDVSTDPYVLNAKGAVSPTIFADLGTGTQYGSISITPSDREEVLSVVLNAAAIGDIMAAQGDYFSIGASLQTIADPPHFQEFVFGASQGSINQLVLTIIPEPSPRLLMIAGLLGFAGWCRARLARRRGK